MPVERLEPDHEQTHTCGRDTDRHRLGETGSPPQDHDGDGGDHGHDQRAAGLGDDCRQNGRGPGALRDEPVEHDPIEPLICRRMVGYPVDDQRLGEQYADDGAHPDDQGQTCWVGAPRSDRPRSRCNDVCRYSDRPQHEHRRGDLHADVSEPHPGISSARTASVRRGALPATTSDRRLAVPAGGSEDRPSVLWPR